MDVTFLIPDMFVTGENPSRFSAPNIRGHFIEEWLAKVGIVDYELTWVQDTTWKRTTEYHGLFNTHISFPNPKDAVLFKLTWHDLRNSTI